MSRRRNRDVGSETLDMPWIVGLALMAVGAIFSAGRWVDFGFPDTFGFLYLAIGAALIIIIRRIQRYSAFKSLLESEDDTK